MIKMIPAAMLFLAMFLPGWAQSIAHAVAEPIKLRIGWQVPWAIQGQIVQIWKHTDILARHGLEADFIGRTYGPVLNELAVAGEVDVVLTADQPAAALFAKMPAWRGISRLMYNRTLTYVPVNSPIQQLEDLRGKAIGIPLGAAAERITLQALQTAETDLPDNVHVINLGIREQGPLVMASPSATAWGNLDALSGFDPIPAIFQDKGLIRVLHQGKVCSLVLMDGKLIDRDPTIPARLNRALLDAYDYYRSHVQEANEWFKQEAGLHLLTDNALRLAAEMEPNLKAVNKASIRLRITDDDFVILQQAADFVAKRTGNQVVMRDFVTNDFVGPPND